MERIRRDRVYTSFLLLGWDVCFVMLPHGCEGLRSLRVRHSGLDMGMLFGGTFMTGYNRLEARGMRYQSRRQVISKGERMLSRHS